MKLSTDMFIVALMAVLAIAAYLLIGMSFTADNVLKGQLMTSILVLLSTMVQLAILSVVVKIRDSITQRRGKRQ